MKNRNGDNIIFEQVAPNKYNFKILDSKGNDASYYWGCSGTDEIRSADPSGGPFLCIGMNIQLYSGRNEVVTKIYFDEGCVIETKNK